MSSISPDKSFFSLLAEESEKKAKMRPASSMSPDLESQGSEMGVPVYMSQSSCFDVEKESEPTVNSPMKSPLQDGFAPVFEDGGSEGRACATDEQQPTDTKQWYGSAKLYFENERETLTKLH